VDRHSHHQLSKKVLVHTQPSYCAYNSYCSYGSVSHIAPAERQPCRGANSLRPHPDGHTLLPTHSRPRVYLAGGHRHLLAATRVFWPEAIAARWSCGPHVTPAQIVVDDAELGYARPPTAWALRRCAAYVATTPK
jgi:hypothetical protein